MTRGELALRLGVAVVLVMIALGGVHPHLWPPLALAMRATWLVLAIVVVSTTAILWVRK